jgi:two-component system cell cycle sensor histidine kinase/response regulator CckA
VSAGSVIPRRRWPAYGLAVAATVGTVLLRLAMGGVGEGREAAEFLFIIPIMLSAYVGGMGPGFVATALAAVSVDYFLVAPHSFSLNADLQSLELATLVLSGILVSLLSEGLHRARRRTEADLSERLELQAQLAAVASTAPGVIYAFRLRPDGTSCIPYASPGMETIFGVRVEDLAEDAAPAFAMMAPEDAARVQGTIAESARTLAPWRDEFRVRRPDGSVVWVEGHSVPQREPDGSILWHGFINDVTERKREEEKHRSTEKRYHDLVHMSPDAIFVNRDNKIVFVNPAALVLFGARAPEELVGRSPFELYHPGSHEVLANRITRLREGHPVPLVLMRIVRLDGGVRDVEAIAASFADRDGPAIQVVLRDVTERRQAERAIEEREEHLSAVIGSAMDGIIAVDERYRITLLNPAAEQMFGVSSAEMVGQSLNRLIPERFREAHTDHIREFGRTYVTRRRIGHLGSVQGLRASGEEFPLEASISQSEVAGRKLFTVILRDITERLQAEEALRASEERFRQLAENIREVFWLTDAQKGQMIYISPGYEAIWGRSCQSLYDSPRNWLDAIHPDDRERVLQAAMSKQVSGTYDEEYRVVRPDGSIRWIRDQAFPVRDANGQVIRVAGVAEDVTARLSLEAQLRQTQRMESIGQLAGGVAHDFNNLLTVIASSAELLGSEVGGESAQDLVRDIRDASGRAAALTRQLLAFSRQEVIEPRVTSLATVLDDAETMLRRLIGEDVILTTINNCACAIKVDPGQWAQVLLNLAVNARDAMPHGGHLTIETRSVDLDEAYQRAHPTVVPGRYALLRVSDTGAGMSAEVRSRIFEPFFTTKANGQGTGLGLAVVYGIVQQSGGHIEVESEPGVGTTFQILVPTTAETVAAERDAGSAPSVRGKETILLVEDEAAVRKIATRTLRAIGYTVLEAADGVEALRVLETNRGAVSLLMTDVVMPNMDGHELTEVVRGRYPAIKVLYTSGYTTDAVVRRGVLQSEVAFLQKPYGPAMLRRRIREVLDLH